MILLLYLITIAISYLIINEFLEDIALIWNFSRELENIINKLSFNIAIYEYENMENFNCCRFLYKFNINDEYFQYCIILNHTYTKNKAEHFQISTIIYNTFSINYINTNAYA